MIEEEKEYLQFSVTDRHHLLMTKLHVPENPLCLVVRERLYSSMSQALRCKLTSIVAPPGYGKTTLVSSWLRSARVRFGWVSLDKGENDRHRFWSYVAKALSQSLSAPEDAADHERNLSSIPFADDRVADWLIARLSDSGETIVLVLDDYHWIESEEIHSDLNTWINRMPAHVHVCLLSRKDIPFPVGAMRAKGSLHEIDMSELRFIDEEIASFWLGRTGEKPDPLLLRDIARYTEGWAAMLQLAVLSHSGNQPGTRQHFSGRHRHVVDYLMEEVFDKLEDEVKRFLVCTSILERMNDSLCSVVTNEPPARAKLFELERRGLFLIALDHERCWYRYHHLFADFLQSRLPYDGVPDANVLHMRAAVWFEAHGYIAEAIDHALEAEAFGQAAAWLETYATNWLKQRETTTLLNWLDRLPKEMADRPMIILIRIWTELMTGLGNRALPRIDRLKASIERWEDTEESGLLARLREEIQIVDNVCAVYSGDFERSVSLIEQLAQRDDLQIDEIPVMLNRGIELNEGTVPFIRGKFGFKGRVGQAGSYHRLYGNFLDKNALHEFPFTAYQQTALCEFLYERNDLEAANAAAKEAVRLGWTYGVIGAYVPAIICLADVFWAAGCTADSKETVEQALQCLIGQHLHASHWFDKITAKQVRQRLALGDTEVTYSWADSWLGKASVGFGPTSDYEWITFIHVMISSGRLDEASRYTGRLLESARQSGNLMSELQALLLLAEICSLQHRIEDSLSRLHAALLIGEREGYLRSFIGAAPHGMERLSLMYGNEILMDKKLSGVSPAYIQSILSASGMAADMAPTTDEPSPASSKTDALTPKELEVLHLMVQGLTNKEIAAALYVTEGTVKLHLHHIYGKLHTSGRIQTVRAAERMGLLTRKKP